MGIFFSFLRTKMLNHMNRSLYGEKERVFILFVLMLGTKTLTYIQSSLYKETYQYYQRICIMGIFEKKKWKKKLLFWVFWASYVPNAKTHAKQLLHRNRTTLFLNFLVTKTPKYMQITVYGVTKQLYVKCVIWVFLFKRMENTLNRETRHYQKRVFCF